MSEKERETAGWLDRRLDDVEALIGHVALAGERVPAFHDQLVSRRSKRLRSLLLLVAGRTGVRSGGIDRDLVRAAAAVELLHEGTLYHDDIVDLAERRRGLPTTHAVHGPAVAALAGSELLYASAELAAGLPMPFRRAYGRTGEALCRGQLREIDALGDERLSPRQRLRIMRDKTACLFSLAAGMGARLANARPEIAQGLRRFGVRFGLCYQLANDLRDLTLSSIDLGREPGADLLDGVMTLPILLALGEPGAESHAVQNMLRRPQDRDGLAESLPTLRRGKGVQVSEGILRLWAERAAEELGPIASKAPDAAGYLHRLTAEVVRLATGTQTGSSRIVTCTM